MTAGRFGLVFRQDLRHQAGRPILWILVLLLAVTAWGLSTGDVRISSGDSSVGGTKAWITSEFNNAKLFAMEIFLFYSLFLAVVAGMAVMQDEELKVGEILHATRLRPWEYLWGKFLAIMAAMGGILVLHIIATIVFNHLVPNSKASEVRGPFSLLNYLKPALIFGLPALVFMGGTSFAIGERTRRPILVFFLPVAAILFAGFFLWSWTPSWLSPGWNRLMMLLDPAGVRWLSETWLQVDRGVAFYNTAPLTFDAPFLLSRLGFVAIGLGSMAWSVHRFAATLRGATARPEARARRGAAVRGSQSGAGVMASREGAAGLAPVPPLSRLGMTVSPPGFLRGAWQVVRFEFAELRSQPGLYLFVPMILLQTLGGCLTALGAFDTPLLITPGTFAVRAMNTLTLLVAFLTLFYTVESFRRERNTGLFQVYFATAARTTSILFGKIAANAFVGVVVAIATFVGGAIALLIQGKVPFDLGPFLLIWGLLLVPTFLLWTSFVMFLFALTNNRYATYGLGLAALAVTGLVQMLGKMSWVGNWNLWDVLLWSDLGVLELDRTAILLNRAAALGATVFFLVLTVRIFPRRDRDATRTMHRLGARPLLLGALRLLPFAAVPLAALVALGMLIEQGFQGKAAEKRAKDYWKQNLATWKDAPSADLQHVDLDLRIEPEERRLRMAGSYRMVNTEAGPLARFALTGGDHWEEVVWTMGGAEYKPENRTGLYVFTPSRALSPGDTVTVGFRYQGVFPKGITKNGGGAREFVLPSGVVLTSFSQSFVPTPGYDESIGIDKDNRYEPRVYPEDHHAGITRPVLGSRAPFTTRIRITTPETYRANSVGVKTDETLAGGLRTVTWESDQPVRFFNVVAGRWDERQGDGTLVFHHPRHAYNVAEMSAALDAARRWYSEWFWPYPWRELRLSEFPGLAFYAQGFPTNITFSEGIGFLTRSDPKTNTAFLVTAHEAAHQWWANLLTPGEGPGGEILAEGMAHFSTILLLEQEKGPRGRMEFCRRIEERYGDRRHADAERPLVRIDGSRNGDETVMYDKGGWVFWMLLNRMGREQALAGMHDFIGRYKDGPDYPLLEDFTAALRPFAPDSVAYDAFVRQWFHEVVMPEYRLTEVKREERSLAQLVEGGEGGTGAEASARSGDGAIAVPGGWLVSGRIENVGTGQAEVTVAAVAGERFDKEGAASAEYREARVNVLLGAGEAREFSIASDFKPERVLVDPDALVLQLQRKNAVATL